MVSTLRHIKQDLNRKSRRENNWTCPICNKSFRYVKEFRKHKNEGCKNNFWTPALIFFIFAVLFIFGLWIFENPSIDYRCYDLINASSTAIEYCLNKK